MLVSCTHEIAAIDKRNLYPNYFMIHERRIEIISNCYSGFIIPIVVDELTINYFKHQYVEVQFGSLKKSEDI